MHGAAKRIRTFTGLSPTTTSSPSVTQSAWAALLFPQECCGPGKGLIYLSQLHCSKAFFALLHGFSNQLLNTLEDMALLGLHVCGPVVFCFVKVTHNLVVGQLLTYPLKYFQNIWHPKALLDVYTHQYGTYSFAFLRFLAFGAG